jgi:AcrR family transcriptional regulator
MVTARRKEKEKEKRRSEIIDAAEKLFFEKGFDGVSMDDVAEKAELAKGTLYLYFKSKDSLFFAVVLRGASILNGMFREYVSKGKTGADKLLSMGVAYYNFYRKYPDYYRLFTYSQSPCFTGGEGDMGEIMRLGQENLELMCKCIGTGQADGSVQKGLDPVKTAWFLMFASSGVIDHSAEQRQAMEAQGISHEEFVLYALDIMGGGILNANRRK